MQRTQRAALATKLLANRRIQDCGYETPCWVWTRYCNPYGYGFVAVPGLGKQVRTHRAAASLWLGFALDSALCVLHRCDNPPCFNPDHLFIGTKKDNTQDMMRKGRQNLEPILGERNHNAKLTEDDVREIRRRVGAGETRKALAREFGVSHVVVGYIVRRMNWGHVA